MQLEALPVEIISGICSFIGCWYIQGLDNEPSVHYFNRDFQALRITCKELYYKTGYDAAMRYSMRLKELDICLDSEGLVRLYQLSKVVPFRDQIRTIYFHHPSRRNCCNSAEGTDHDNGIGREGASPTELLREEISTSYWASSDAVHLLAACFRNLKSAKNLSGVELHSNFGHDLILHGLLIAKFPHKIAHIPIQPKDFSTVGYGSFSHSTQRFLTVVKGLLIQPFLSNAQRSIQPLTPQQKADNFEGLHLQNYRPTTKALTRFISALNSIESLKFYGCRLHPSLRSCHGCDDLFVQNFACTSYPNLTHLSVDNMFISGSRFRGFVKRQAKTLRIVEISHVTLTDGSWRSIAQGLAKLELQCLRITSLIQKKPARVVTQGVFPPKGYSSNYQVDVENEPQVREFLRNLILSFKTVVCTDSSRFSKPPPKYHEVRLFQPGNKKSIWE